MTCATCGFDSTDRERAHACAERAALVESRRAEMRAHLDRECDCLTCEVMPRKRTGDAHNTEQAPPENATELQKEPNDG